MGKGIRRPPVVLRLEDYSDATRRFEVGALLVIPLFAVYEVALFSATGGSVRNAAEVLLKRMLGIEYGLGLILVNSALLVTFLLVALRGPRSSIALLPFVLLESAIYALLLGPGLSLFRSFLCVVPPDRKLDAVILGLGAGLYEELLFRLVGVGASFVLLHRGLKVDRVWALVSSLLASSILFSAYHHVGDGGEPWSSSVFVFRFLAGLLLGWLFWLRGFGVATWAHALYDVFLAL